MKLNCYILFTILIFCACESSSDGEKKLGNVNLVVTGNVKAQEHFKKGLLYLHSFEYLDARAEFVKAQQADQLCGMAYWGEIMAYNHPLFNRELTRLASQTFNKMGASKEAKRRLFKSEMELDLLTSIEILFGSGTKPERDKAYRLYYEKLAKKYKGNHEIEAFYALALLASPLSDKTDNLFEHSAKISEGILSQNPNHPGALHYLIHANDHPTRAKFGVEAADRYSKVAPDAIHALHMPSHIYLSLGRWNDVINSNIDSWNAGVKARLVQPKREIGYHSLSWLQYGLFQTSEIELATKLTKNMMAYDAIDQTGLARSYNVAMKGTHLAATNNWEGEIADWNFKIDDLHLTKKSGYNFLEGMKAYHSNDIKKLKNIIAQIGKDKYTASLNLSDNSTAMCNTAGNPSIPPNQMDVDIVSILEYELKAYLNKLDGKGKEQLTNLEKGVELYEELNMSFGPPVIFIPVHQIYAQALIDNNQFEKALNVINRGLETTPKKLQYLKMIKIIAEKTNNPSALKDINTEIEKLLKSNNRKEILTFKS